METDDLWYLARQRKPVWQMVAKMQPIPPEEKAALDAGLIAIEDGGFVITQKGRDYLATKRCPTCGHEWQR